MFGWLRRRPRIRNVEPGEQFHQDVMACLRALEPRLRVVSKRYPTQVFAVAAALHVRATLRLCLQRKLLTETQIRRLIDPLFEPDDQEPGSKL